MKVLHESPKELRLKHTSDLGAGLFVSLFVVLFLGVPLLSLHSIAQEAKTVTLSCRRAQPDVVNCTRQDTTGIGLWSSKIEFNQVSAASWQRITNENYKPIERYSKPQYVVLLETGQDKVVLVEDSSFDASGKLSDVREVSQRLNRFISSERPEFQYKIENSLAFNPWPVFGLCGFMALIGLGCLYGIYEKFQVEELHFHKELGQLRRQRWPLLGPRRQVIPLADITGLTINTSRSTIELGYGVTLKTQEHSVRRLPDSLKTRPLMMAKSYNHALFIKKKIQEFLKA